MVVPDDYQTRYYRPQSRNLTHASPSDVVTKTMKTTNATHAHHPNTGKRRSKSPLPQRHTHSRRSSSLRNPLVAAAPASVDSLQAEQAAQQLERELAQKGYNPYNGGRMMRQTSYDSNEGSQYIDKYWQTPEQESRSLEEYYEHGDDYTSYCTEEIHDEEDETRFDTYTEGSYTDTDDGETYSTAYHTSSKKHKRTTAILEKDSWDPLGRASNNKQVPTSKEPSSNRHKYRDRNGFHTNGKELPTQSNDTKKNKVIQTATNNQRCSSSSSSDSATSDDSFLLVFGMPDRRSQKCEVKNKKLPKTQGLTPNKRGPYLQQNDDSVIQFQMRNTSHITPTTAKTDSYLTRESYGRKSVTGDYDHNRRKNSSHSHMYGMPKSPVAEAMPPLTYHGSGDHERNSFNDDRDSPDLSNERGTVTKPQAANKKKAMGPNKLQEMSSLSFDRNLDQVQSSTNDGRPPSKVVVPTAAVRIEDQRVGSRHPHKNIPWKYSEVSPKAQTSLTRLLGKELLFVNPNNEKTKTKDPDKPTSQKVSLPPSVSLTVTPPTAIDPGYSIPQKQPDFLLQDSREPQDMIMDAHIVSTDVVGGDIELQLSKSMNTGFAPLYNDHPTSLKISSFKYREKKEESRLKMKPHSFRKLLSGRKDPTTTTFSLSRRLDPAVTQREHNDDNYDGDGECDDDDCGLISKKKLVQQGWSPGDIPDQIEPASADTSLFGRLIALRREKKGSRHNFSRRRHPKDPIIREDVEHESEEKEKQHRVVPFAPTESWEVFSHDTGFLSEEIEMKTNPVVKRQVVSAAHHTESDCGSDNISADGFVAEPFKAPKALVFQIPLWQEQTDKKRPDLLGRVIPSKRKSKMQMQDSNVHSDPVPRSSHSSPSASVWGPSLSSKERGRAYAKGSPSISKGCSTDGALSLNSLHDDAVAKVHCVGNRKLQKSPTDYDHTKQQSSSVSSVERMQDAPTVFEKTNMENRPIVSNEFTKDASVEHSRHSVSNDNDSVENVRNEESQRSAPVDPNSDLETKSPSVIDAPTSIETKFFNKSQEVTSSPVEKALSNIMSNESDDGIPVPSVSIQELRDLLDPQSDMVEKWGAIQAAESIEVSSSEVIDIKTRMFGIPRVLQRDQAQSVNIGHTIVEGEQTREDKEEIEKENSTIESKPQTASDKVPVLWKAKGGKSLADSASIQSSSVGTESADGNSKAACSPGGTKDNNGVLNVIATHGLTKLEVDKQFDENIFGFEMQASQPDIRIETDTFKKDELNAHGPTFSAIKSSRKSEDLNSPSSNARGLSPGSRVLVDRKNVRFAESLEMIQEFLTPTLSTSSTFDESRQIPGSAESESDEKVNGSKKKILRWISARSKKRKASRLRKRTSLPPVVEEEGEDTHEDGDSGGSRSLFPDGTQINGPRMRSEVAIVSAPVRHHRKFDLESEKHHATEKAVSKNKKPPSSSDGNDDIELIARRTKSGKNAILISKTGTATSRERPRPPKEELIGGKQLRNASLMKQGIEDGHHAGTERRMAQYQSPSSSRNELKSQQKKGLMRIFQLGKGKRTKNQKMKRHQLAKASTNSVVAPTNRTTPQQHRASPDDNYQRKQHTTTETNTKRKVESSIKRNGMALGRLEHQNGRIDRLPSENFPIKDDYGREIPHSFSSRPNTPSPDIVMQTQNQEDLNYGLIEDSRQPAIPMPSGASQRESSLNNKTARTSSTFSDRCLEASAEEVVEPRSSERVAMHSPALSQPKVEDDWFSWLLPGIFAPVPVAKPVTDVKEPQVRIPEMSRDSSTYTRKSNGSRYTQGSRSTVASSYYVEEDSQDCTHSTPSTASDGEEAVKGKRSVKKTTNTMPTAPKEPGIDNREESERIPAKQWQEILDATEVLAMSYKVQQRRQRSHSHELALKQKATNDGKSVSDDTIDEVKRAIRKFREHARSLGVRERELMEAVRDDDRSVPSWRRHKKQPAFHNVSKSNVESATTSGGVTDKFIEMFDYFFAPKHVSNTETGHR